MNSSQRRKVMFGEKAVIEMDIDPFVSNLDTPSDLKVPPPYTYTIQKYSTPHISPPPTTTETHASKKVPVDDEKKENDARDPEEPLAKKKC